MGRSVGNYSRVCCQTESVENCCRDGEELPRDGVL